MPVGCAEGSAVGATVGLFVACDGMPGSPVGCDVGAAVGLPVEWDAELPEWAAEFPELPDGEDASRVVQYDETLSLPPAAVISAVKAGFSRALPGLLPAPAS